MSTQEKFSLEGKACVVTGAASGIGRAVSQLFASQRGRLVVVDRHAEGLRETVDTIKADGGTVVAHTADVGVEKDVKAYMGACEDAYGTIDVLHANAGISGEGVGVEEITPELFMEVMRINLLGPFLAAKHAIAPMVKNKKGSIICTASVAGIASGAGNTAYSASKAGVISLVKTMAYNLYGTGVRINAVCPGIIETNMTKPIFDMARSKGTDHKIGQLNPLTRYGDPKEIAGAALFLASDQSSYVNGQALPVDGGLSSSLPYILPRR